MSTAVSIIGLGATLALLGVTYWYARITKGMAETAQKSAADSARATAAAERSAEAARDAARVAQAQIKPDFIGKFILVGDRDAFQHTLCIRIDATGDAVVIQRVRIRRGFRKSYDTDSETAHSMVENVELHSAGWDTHLPQRVHFGEFIFVTHECLEEPEDDPLNRVLLDVVYTFSEDGGAGATKQLIVDAK